MCKYRGENLHPFEGYASQLSRALYHLLNEQGSINIEKEDDISVIKDNQIIVAEQLKRISGKLKYNSQAFINTLHNWIDLYRKNIDKISSTKFIIFLENSNEVDDYIKQCHAATNIQQAQAIVDEIVAKINWTTKANKQRSQFFLSNRHIIYNIIKNFSLQKPKNVSSENDINDLLYTKYGEFLNERFPRFVNELKGVFYSKVINSDKRIKNTTYHKLFLEKFFLSFGGIEKVLYMPKVDDIEDKIKKELSQRYVEQLKIINCDREVKLAAIKARVEWSLLQERECEYGLSTEKNFKDMYKNMKDIWAENKSVIWNNENISDVQKGKELYNKSLSEEVVVDGVKFKDSKRISRGVHNHMANFEDELGIGWHPDYERKLHRNE